MKIHTHFFLLAMTAATLTASACSNKSTEPDNGSILFSFNVMSENEEGTRSRITASDETISTLELFIFDVETGGLSRHLSFNSTQGCRADNLVQDREYIVYALANCSPQSYPDRISDMENMVINMLSFEEINSTGLPMAGISGTILHDGSFSEVQIPLERVVSKIIVTLDTSNLKGNFTASNIVLHNVPSSILPFGENSPEDEGIVPEGDNATPVDISRLNGGNSIALIVGENLQSSLLEGNTDPWNKVPENIEEKKNRCTYLSVAGIYENSGLTISDLTYNMYLGEDNVTNFDIRRNRIYDLTLSLSDEGTSLASSWKVGPGNTEDSRTLRFNSDSIGLYMDSIISVSVICEPSPFDYDLIEGDGFKDANLSYRVEENGTITIISGAFNRRQFTGRLWARSWDRRKSAYVDITVKRTEEYNRTPLGVYLVPKDTTVHVGDTVSLRGYVVYGSGDTLLNHSLVDYMIPSDRVLTKKARSNQVVANNVGYAKPICILKSNYSLMDSCHITVIQ